MKLKQLRKRFRAGTVLGALAAVYITVYLIQTIQHNYELQNQINQLRTQVSQLQSDQQTLKYQIQYYQTGDYQEEAARAKLGLQAPGEGVVIVPHSTTDTSQFAQPVRAKGVPVKSHWQQWIDFLRGAGTS